MEEIKHRMVSVNGIKMHIAEKGEGPVVLFLHGFPDLWYSWHHQILALSSLGYRAVAPDLRGFGDTEAPISITSYTYFHIIGDIIALIDSLGIEQVYLVAHDFGAVIACHLCLFRPERVKAFVTLGVPFRPRNPEQSPVQFLRALRGDDYYVCRFQEPGKMEQVFARISTAELFLAKDKPEFGPLVMLEENARINGKNPANPVNWPTWLSEEDFSFYVTKFDQTGFTGGLNYYRALDLNWELTAAWTGVQVKVQVLFVVGEDDPVYAREERYKVYIHNGCFKKDVPLLDEIVVMKDAGHFINQQRPEEISNLIYNFIKKFP